MNFRERKKEMRDGDRGRDFCAISERKGKRERERVRETEQREYAYLFIHREM